MSSLRKRISPTPAQRAAILRAAADGRMRGPVRMVNGKMPYDAVSLACDTRNFWWQGGMDNATCGCALRLVHMSLRLGPR